MTVKEYIEKGNTLLLDGATGTQLILRGFQSGECPEMWNIDRPEDVKAIAGGYFEAGSDAVLTNTFGGSILKLKSFGLEDRVAELNKAAVALAKEVCPPNRYVVGSVGPSGEFMQPMGLVSEEEMIASYTEQIKALEAGGVDAFMVETFTDINEQKCAIKAIKDNSDKPFFCSLTYDKTAAGYATIMGVKIAQAAEILTAEGALVVGSNCGHGIENMIEIAKEYRAASPELKVLAKANAGIPQYKNGETVYTEGPDFFAKQLPELLSVGISVLGGCCGTGPGHVQEMRNAINEKG